MKPGKIVLLFVIAAFAIILAVNFSGNTSIYTTFSNAKVSGRTVHIVGEWVDRDASAYDPNRDVFTFYMRDSLQQVEKVIYHDPKPNNFETAEKVVVIGSYKKDDFVADKIIMKCPSKYEATDITTEDQPSFN